MKENLTDLAEVMELLGYQDERSAEKWCTRNNILIIKLGAKKYIAKHLLTQYIENQIVIFEDKKDSKPKVEAKKKKFQPENEIILKYLAKYESDNKSKAA